MTILDAIVAQTRADLAERRRRVPLAELEVRPLRTVEPHRFAAALRGPGLSLIAEIKPKSPSRGALRSASEVPAIVEIYDRHAQAISVLRDRPYFGGGYGLLSSVREMTGRPILAKDFVVDRYQLFEARSAGADAVLLMAAVLDGAQLAALLDEATSLGLDALVEAHDDAELQVALDSGARIVGVNSRDLKTLEIDHERANALLAAVPTDRVRVAESGVSTEPDVARIRDRADAALVGSALMAADDVERRIEALGW